METIIATLTNIITAANALAGLREDRIFGECTDGSAEITGTLRRLRAMAGPAADALAQIRHGEPQMAAEMLYHSVEEVRQSGGYEAANKIEDLYLAIEDAIQSGE